MFSRKVGKQRKKVLMDHFGIQGDDHEWDDLNTRYKEDLKKKRKERRKITRREVYYITLKNVYSVDFKNTTEKYNGREYTSTETQTEIFQTDLVRNIKNLAREKTDRWIDEKLGNSAVVNVSLKSRSISYTKGENGTNQKSIKMKNACCLMLDGNGKHDWDTKTGKCVFDYLIHKYKNVLGFTKMCRSYETLSDVFTEDDIDNDFPNPIENGVCTEQIETFCRKGRISMYALDETESVISIYTPDKINKNIGADPLCFRVMNSHFYPILDRNPNSLKRLISGNNVYTDIIQTPNKKAKTLDPKLIKEIITTDPNNSAIEIMKELGIQARAKNVIFDGSIRSFIVGDTKYLMVSEEESMNQQFVKRYCEFNNNEYTGQSVGQIVSELMKEAETNLVKGVYNPHTKDMLSAEGIKWRTHFGKICEDFGENLTAYDINKSHKSNMVSPKDDWIIPQFNDTFEIYTRECEDHEITLGLYFVETDDFTLLHGDNIYENKIVQLALDENIITKRNIKYVMNVKPKIERHTMKDIIDYISSKSPDECVKKLLCNNVAGLLGKTHTTKYKANLNTNIQQAFTTIQKYEKPFISQIAEYNIYGAQYTTEHSEHNVPMYIQILDWEKINLYNLGKKLKGKIVYRKTDCVVVEDATNKIQTSKRDGDVSKCDIPKMISMMKTERKVEFKIFGNYKTMPYDTSSKHQEILKNALSNGGGVIIGGPGTGKSHIIQNLKETNRVLCAPTHKAAYNIGGETVHHTIGLNIEYNISEKTIRKFKQDKPIIIIDEISMVSSMMWKALCELKRRTECKFLLFGDDKQLLAVEPNPQDHFKSSAVFYLANGLMCELTVQHRFDEKLAKILADIPNIDLEMFQNEAPTSLNLCFTNQTRKGINAELNEKRGLFVERNMFDESSQDMYIYKGVPLIAKETTSEFFNNEKFVVKNTFAESITLENDRTQIEIHRLDLSTFFNLSFATTVHKSQGDSINENFTIWEWNKMNKRMKYTALSRATCAEIVSIKTNSYQKSNVVSSNHRITGYYTQDIAKGRKCDITKEYVDDLLKDSICAHCLCEITQRNWSVDRIDDRLGHLMGNVKISCLSCNHAKRKI